MNNKEINKNNNKESYKKFVFGGFILTLLGVVIYFIIYDNPESAVYGRIRDVVLSILPALIIVSATLYNNEGRIIEIVNNAIVKLRGELNKDFNKINERITKTETEVKDMKDYFVENPRFIKGGSPLTLTDEGKDILKKGKGKEFLKENFNDLYIKFNDVDDAYFIQEKAKNVMYDVDVRNKVINSNKDVLYQQGIILRDLLSVMSFTLRDMVIEEKKKEGKLSDK